MMTCRKKETRGRCEEEDECKGVVERYKQTGAGDENKEIRERKEEKGRERTAIERFRRRDGSYEDRKKETDERLKEENKAKGEN